MTTTDPATAPHGLALVGEFVLRQRSLTRRGEPLLDLRTLTHRTWGSSLLATAQQVAAAVGTALTVTVLSWRWTQLLGAGATEAAAFVGGVRRPSGSRPCSRSGSWCWPLLPNRAAPHAAGAGAGTRAAAR